MATLVGAYTETRIRTRKDGKPETPRQTFQRLQTALNQLCGRTIQGYEINGVQFREMYDEIENPCIVPDFGHNSNCKCEHPEPNGVLRLFMLEFVVDGYPDDTFLGTYQVSEDVRIQVCSKSEEPEPGEPLVKL